MAFSLFVYLTYFLVFVPCAFAKYNVVEVTLAEDILGFRVAKGDANVILIEDDGTESIYHAQLSKVSAELVKHGVSAGDMLTGIDDWNAANRPVRMISKHLKKTKKRPVTLTFGKVDLSADVPDETSSDNDEKKVESFTREASEQLAADDAEQQASEQLAADDAEQQASEQPAADDAEQQASEQPAADDDADDADETCSVDAKTGKSSCPSSAELPESQPGMKDIVFEEKSLGVFLDTEDAGTTLSDGNVYNAKILDVKNMAVVTQGLEQDDVVVQVADWSAKGATVAEVVAQIKKHSSRPLTIKFGAVVTSEEHKQTESVKKEAKKETTTAKPGTRKRKQKTSDEADAKWGNSITFKRKVLGFKIDKVPGEARIKGGLYTAIVDEVTDSVAKQQGLKEGDVVVRVADWSAEGASVEEVVAKIRSHTKRSPSFKVFSVPLIIAFATPRDVSAVEFKGQSLGIRIHGRDVFARVSGEVYNARVDEVLDSAVAEQGLRKGDVIKAIGEWSAKGVSMVDVVKKIKAHSTRPLVIEFAIPEEVVHTRVEFTEKSLGIRLSKEDAITNVAGELYNAAVIEVLDEAVAKQGLKTGDVIVQVEDWSAKDATVADIYAHIKEITARPLVILFGSPGASSHEDEQEFAEAPAPVPSLAEFEGVDNRLSAADALPLIHVDFANKRLGIDIEKSEAGLEAGGHIYNARVERVKGKEAKENGVLVGDLVTHVGNWNAKGAKVHDVVTRIMRHSARPLRLTFATPDSVREAKEEEKRRLEERKKRPLGKAFVFQDRKLGLKFNKTDAPVKLRGRTYNVRITRVDSYDLFKAGVSSGDYIVKVAGWDTAGASLKEVVTRIKKFRNHLGYRRPMNLTIAATRSEKRYEESIKEEEAEAAAAARKAEEQRERKATQKAAAKRAAARIKKKDAENEVKVTAEKAKATAVI